MRSRSSSMPAERAEFIEERLMDAVVCASGSSPAFVYQFIEALGRRRGQIWHAEKAGLRICGTGGERCGCHGAWRLENIRES